MKRIPRHTHSIEIEFSGKHSLLFRATFPLKKRGREHISAWYKRTKLALASSCEMPVWQIKGRHKIIQSTLFDRILFEWAGGICIELPDDATPYDFEIILHYLEGLKMSLR